MNMTILGGENSTPVLDKDDIDRSKFIDVTLLRKTCLNTGVGVLRCLRGHYRSSPKYSLGDHVVRIQLSIETIELLNNSPAREEIISRILMKYL